MERVGEQKARMEWSRPGRANPMEDGSSEVFPHYP